MNPDLSRNDSRDLKQLLLRQQAITFGLLGALVLLSLTLLRHQPKVILEPPTRATSFTVQGDRVDENYLIEMAQYVAHMMLDVTPATIESRNDEVLRWVHPATFGTLQNRMAVAARRLKEANATTVFWPTQVAPDPEHLRVAVIGSLETYVNGTRVQADRTQSWLLQFESRGGRMLIRDWAETPLDDPMLARALASPPAPTGDRHAP